MKTKDKKKIIGKHNGECQGCDYSEHPEILTIHHIFKKGNYKYQPSFKRNFRCVVLCPNCHKLAELGIMNKKLKGIIIKKLNECKKHYGENEDIDTELMKLGAWKPEVIKIN